MHSLAWLLAGVVADRLDSRQQLLGERRRHGGPVMLRENEPRRSRRGSSESRPLFFLIFLIGEHFKLGAL